MILGTFPPSFFCCGLDIFFSCLLSFFNDLPLVVSPSPVLEDFVSFLSFNSFEFKADYTSSRNNESLPNSKVSLKCA